VANDGITAGQVNQRRYEALRAYLFEDASLQQAADSAGYTTRRAPNPVTSLTASGH